MITIPTLAGRIAVARRAFMVALEERISGYKIRLGDYEKVEKWGGLIKEYNEGCTAGIRESRDYWIGVLKRVTDGEKVARDSQPGDLFAKVYQQMGLPPGEYDTISAQFLK